ncbi:MAG: hypothetical protein U0W40_06550 [Acidimicrobiia bacterium]
MLPAAAEEQAQRASVAPSTGWGAHRPVVVVSMRRPRWVRAVRRRSEQLDHGVRGVDGAAGVAAR